MDWMALTFDELTVRNLHAIFKLRCEIFVVEQNCPYQEVDNHDLQAIHIMCLNDEGLIACARILPPQTNKPFPSIGRVAVRKKDRANGIGRQLMHYTIETTQKIFPRQDIVISAQCYLKNFYQSLDFEIVGNEYLEDNIPHIQMVKRFNLIPN